MATIKQGAESYDVDSLSWFHTIDLGNGIITPGTKGGGGDFMQQELERLSLPDDMVGCHVLDVGTRDGFYAFECCRRGARVEAIDTWPSNNKGGSKTFYFAYSTLIAKGFSIWPRQMSVYDIEATNQFDISLMLGVLYHLKDPYLGLRRVVGATKPGGLVVVESHYSDVCPETRSRLDLNIPVMEFLPNDELNNDPSCWWSPNVQCIIDMMTSAGCSRVEEINRWNDRVILHGHK